LLFLSSCRKYERIIETTVTTPNPTIESYIPPSNLVTGGVIGFVVDKNNEPVADAMVKLNSNTFTTDAYGHIFIENESMNSLGTLVSVEKDGYFEGSRRFFPIEGKQSRIKIQLLEKTFDKSFDASNGGTIETTNGAKVEFSPNSIKTADGNSYSGTVHVAAKWMDPSLSATLDQMPGNLQGVNAQVEQVALGTYGMIAVELEGDAGESLNIADGNTAKITMPVPSSMISAAPAEIPLWSYNKEFGLWVEESTATLQGDKYVGDVSHFSFWNCDIPYDYVNLEMTLVDDNGIPLNNYVVTLTLGSSNALSSGSGYTDQNGNVSGFIPGNEVLTMNILDVCGDVLSTQDIGPFSVDTDLGDITVSGVNVNETTITGTLLDCSGSPLTEGIVIAQFQGQSIYHYTTTSNFSMTFSSCTNTSDIEVIAINTTSLEQSDIVLATPHIQNDLGGISVCGSQLQNFITMTIDGVTGVFTNNNVAANATSTFIQSGSLNWEIAFGFEGITTGDYTSLAYNVVTIVPTLGWDYGVVIFSSFEVTQHDTFVVGSFEGEIDDNGNMLPITCTFSVEL
jgi:hypothetical protein